MFGARKQIVSRLIHINFSAETVLEKNYQTVKEYCHLTYDQDGWIQHTIVDASNIKYTASDEYIEPMISINANAISGTTKGVEIFIPRNGTLNSI